MDYISIDSNSRHNLYADQINLYKHLEGNIARQITHISGVLDLIQITGDVSPTFQTFPEWWSEQVVNMLKILMKVEEDVIHFMESNKTEQTILGLSMISARILNKLTPSELSSIKICTNQIIAIVKSELEIAMSDEDLEIKAKQISSLRGGGQPIEDYMKANFPFLVSAPKEREAMILTGMTKEELEDITGLDDEQIEVFIHEIEVLEGVTKNEYEEAMKTRLDDLLYLTGLSIQELALEAKLKLESLRILMDQPLDLFSKLSSLVLSLQLSLVALSFEERLKSKN